MLAPSRHHRAVAKFNVSTDCMSPSLLTFLYYLTPSVPHLGLHSAAVSGDIGLVQYALSHGQPVNSVLDGVLPLHAACAGGNDLVVNLLIKHGADVNASRSVHPIVLPVSLPIIHLPTPQTTPQIFRS